MRGWKAGVVVGLVVALVGSTAFAFAQEGGQQRQRRQKGAVLKGIVHADLILAGRSGETREVVYDRGEITSIDADGRSFDLQRRDGETVTVLVSDDTRIVEQGRQESFEDLDVGDRLMAFAEKAGESLHWFLLRCVRSPQEQPELTAA